MKMENQSPFPNLRFYSMDNQRKEFGVLIVKGTYLIGPDGWLTLSDQQEPLVLTDTYYGELNVSSLRTPSDLVPIKPRSDVIVNAVARAPNGLPARSWLCGVSVEGEHAIAKRLRVTGPRWWESQWSVSKKVLSTLTERERRKVFSGWRLGDPEPVTEVPIVYELAFGGTQVRPQEGDKPPTIVADECNPIGLGWIDREMTPSEQSTPAPQIEDESDPLGDPYRRHTPAGFGAIPPAWLPRRPLGGTYDDQWRENVWPNWPEDYDFAYHNSANPALIYPDILLGHEIIKLFGFDRDLSERTLRLPLHVMVVKVDYEDGDPIKTVMDLDTVLIDIAAPDPKDHRVFLSWRFTFDHKQAENLSFALTAFAGSPDYPELEQAS